MGEYTKRIFFIPYSCNFFSHHFLKTKPFCPDKSTIAFALLLLVAALSLLIIPSQTLADEEYRFERMWPTLQQPWFFNAPEGIAVAPDGSVYVADTWNFRIQKFTSDGQFVTKWGTPGSGDGQFSVPEGIAVAPDGSVYVADTNNHRIQKFTASGQFLTKWGTEGSGDGQFSVPEGIAIAPDGSVYVADSWNDRIQKFTASGQFLTKWGTEGSGDGQFSVPEGIAIAPDGSVYVADSWNDRIQKFTASGQFITKWGSDGSGDGQFSVPEGIAVAPDGSVYAVEYNNDRVQKFTSDGQFVTKWGSWGKGDGQLFNVTGIAIAPNGLVYVTDQLDRAQKFTASGQFVTKWGSGGNGDGQFDLPEGVAIGPDDSVYVADTRNARIQKFSASGQFVTKWGTRGTGDGQFADPAGIAIAPDGSVYVADTWNYRIQKFSASGQFITKWGGEGSGYAGSGSEDGQFYIPSGIAVAPDGSVYVADTWNDRIQKFSASGQFITKWGTSGSGDGLFGHPLGIAIAPDGSVFVADRNNDRIQKFTASGQFVSKWGSEGSGNGQFTAPLGIAVAPDGSVFVADIGNAQIQKFTASGQFITKWGTSGSAPGDFFGLKGVAVDSSGAVFACEYGSNRIQVFSKATTPDPGVRRDKAIIVAGSGPSSGSWVNNIWDATSLCANFAYRALTYQGYTNETIYYLSSDTGLDLNGDGIPDVDGDATNSNLQSAITTWAQDAENLFIYLAGHGGNGTFRMQPTELLQATDLDSWIDTIQGTIPGEVVMLYDACRSGSFVPLLLPSSGKERILVTSASTDEEALFQSQGVNSFSFSFWGLLFNGETFYDSFVFAKDAISATYHQTPLLDGNGNGEGNEREDQEKAREVQIGNETRTGGALPVIGSVSPARSLNGETSALIYAANVIDEDGISRVWAIITPPGYSPGSPDIPVTNLPMLDLTSAGNNRYEGTYTGFAQTGTYNVAIYAADGNGVISLPMQTTVTQGTGGETEPIPLNVFGFITDLTGPPAAETPVEITFTAQGDSGTLYYRYYQASGYQTQNFGNWQRLKDWSIDNSLTWFSFSDDHYIIVVHVTDDTTSENYHQAGLSIETSGNSANPIQITDFTTDIDYPQSSGGAVTISTTATGGSGSLYYRYYYSKGVGGQWIEIQAYSIDNSCIWTPTEDGLYVVVVHVTDDISGSIFSTAGMTCTIGE